ncbi:MAG: flavin reductase family protein [Sulfurospirillum sp.]|nr:flavin reductase family protein [Sulfurospirillum sp.]
MILDYKDIDDLNRYKIMSGTVVPRPIAWIVTKDEGIVNAAPFSYFIPLSSNPATIIVSIGKKDADTPKDTLANILKNKKATICFANEANLEELKLSSTALAKSESEIEKYSIKVTKILEDFPPMISSSQSALFCTLHSSINLGGDTTPVILEIKKQFIKDECINEKLHVSMKNIGRIGVSFAKMVSI